MGLGDAARLVGFGRARYAHAATDLQVFFATAVDDRVDDQTEFLSRFVYFEALSACLRSLGAPEPDFDDFKKDFKKLELFGCLAGAILLAMEVNLLIIQCPINPSHDESFCRCLSPRKRPSPPQRQRPRSPASA